MAATNTDPEITTEQFPIRELSARTQVNTVTIRAWERRYGLLKPQRTTKGHRLYTPDDARRVEMILALIARGVPLGKVKKLLDQEQGGNEIERFVGDDSWAEQVNGLLKCARQFSATRMEAYLGDQLIQYPPKTCLENLLMPAFEELQNDNDHLATWTFAENEILRYVVSRLNARKTARGKPAISLARGDKAPLWRMAMIALELADCDYRVQLICQRIPERTWLAMAKAQKDTIHVFYQDGLWNEGTARDVGCALESDRKLIVCGTAPNVSGLTTVNQVFPDLEQYAAFQIQQKQ